MKTQRSIVKLFMLSAAVLAAFTSCADKPKIPDFYNTGYVSYVRQISTPDGDGETHLYRRCIGFTTGGKEEFGNGTLSLSGVQLSGEKVGRAYQLTDGAGNITDDITTFNGEYSVSSVGAEGTEAYSGLFVEWSFTGVEPLGAVTVSDFKLENGKVSCLFGGVAAGALYGFYFQPYVDGNLLPTYAYDFFPSEWMSIAAEAGTQEYSLPLNDLLARMIYYQYPKVRITPMVLAVNPNKKGALIRFAPTGKSYTYGETSLAD